MIPMLVNELFANFGQQINYDKLDNAHMMHIPVRKARLLIVSTIIEFRGNGGFPKNENVIKW